MEPSPEMVQCHSSYRYAQQPVSFTWEGTYFAVDRIEKEWLEPGRRLFIVKTTDDRTFELCYYESTNFWLVQAR